ncbi:hypothetical protein V1477_009103 [Vespula maculifrons]|uniref:Uncharacterized protein n=1 Tax=Vespula maculifrons TaxID=7453 RepID=A0ABD2CFC4_VESMC
MCIHTKEVLYMPCTNTYNPSLDFCKNDANFRLSQQLYFRIWGLIALTIFTAYITKSSFPRVA